LLPTNLVPGGQPRPAQIVGWVVVVVVVAGIVVITAVAGMEVVDMPKSGKGQSSELLTMEPS